MNWTALEAIATTLAVLIALFAGPIRHWLRSPRLTIARIDTSPVYVPVLDSSGQMIYDSDGYAQVEPQATGFKAPVVQACCQQLATCKEGLSDHGFAAQQVPHHQACISTAG